MAFSELLHLKAARRGTKIGARIILCEPRSAARMEVFVVEGRGVG